MGRKKKDNTEYTEEIIQNILSLHFMSDSNIKYKAENLWIYTWESDFWLMTKSNLCYEFEIKISKTDFKNEFKHKIEKHSLLENKNEELIKPNYFYFAVPENLISIEDIPEYAGLIYITDIFPYYEIIKSAPKLTDNKQDENTLNLIGKFYYNYRDWKHKVIVERNYNEELNKLIDEYSEKPSKEKKHYSKLLEENKTMKLVINNETESSKMYKDLYFKMSQENRAYEHIVRRLRELLDNNNITYNIEEIYGEW